MGFTVAMRTSLSHNLLCRSAGDNRRGPGRSSDPIQVVAPVPSGRRGNLRQALARR